jgi:seryl-tRNA synthetase
MHDIKFFETNTNEVKDNLKKRGMDVSIVDQCLALNGKRKELTTYVDTNRAELNKFSKEIGMLKKNGEDASEVMSKVSQLKKNMETKTQELGKAEKDLNFLLSTIPNLLHKDVPEGDDENSNIEIKSWGKIPSFDYKPKDHVELGESLGMLDFDRAAKITGARFALYRKDLARLEEHLLTLCSRNMQRRDMKKLFRLILLMMIPFLEQDNYQSLKKTSLNLISKTKITTLFLPQKFH